MQEGKKLRRQLFLEIWLVIFYFVGEGLVITTLEGTLTVQHLVEYATNSINIAFEVDSTRPLESLGGKVERSSQKGISIIVLT